MAIERRTTPTEAGPAGAPADGQQSLGELVRELARESADLVRRETVLAKLEMKETATQILADAVKIGVALGLAAAGGLALTAFLILVIGNLLDGAFWAGALIVGILFLAVGALLARRAMKDLKKTGLKPDDTIETLREDARWARDEARDFKREVA